MVAKNLDKLALLLSLLKALLVHSAGIYIPETTNGELCIIPFSYRGKFYHDCISDGASRPWCYTEKTFTEWDYCKPHPNEFGNCDLATPNVTAAEIKEILDEHNAFRSKLPALRMRKLSWNTELAKRAQAAANLCKHEHVLRSLCGGRESSGQNIFYNSDRDRYPGLSSWETVIENWSSEKQFFNLKTNECQDGNICGHFTQIAWDKTHLVGCGKAACHGKIEDKLLYSMLYYCNYYEAGNRGNRPPYVESTKNKCEDCHIFDSREKFRCDENKLCETCPKSGLEQCVGIGDIKGMNVCADMDVSCADNIDLCGKLNLPTPVLDYLKNCKKTCKMCS